MSGYCSDSSSAGTDDKMIFSRIIFCLLFSLSAFLGKAQFVATIKASVDKNRILIGEPFVLTVEAGLSADLAIKFISVDSIPHFELLETLAIDTTIKEGILYIRGLYRITSFDSGHWVIPSFSLSKTVKTDTIPIDIVFSEFDPNQPYHDIKDILEVEPAKKKQWWWYIGGGILLLVLLLTWLLRKKKPVMVVKPAVVIDPFEEAMRQLAQLKKEKPDTKNYYSTLTDIFRLYVFRKKGILSLQKTTGDLVIRLRDLDLDKDQFNKLSQSLQLSDFVKFAKYIPSPEDDIQAFSTIGRSIEAIEQKKDAV
ncbi:MAG: hypothetical protein ABIT05_09400 [Chitinophagaceae bacterium]